MSGRVKAPNYDGRLENWLGGNVYVAAAQPATACGLRRATMQSAIRSHLRPKESKEIPRAVNLLNLAQSLQGEFVPSPITRPCRGVVMNQLKTKSSNLVNRTFYKLFFLCEDWQSMNRALALKEKLAQNCRERVIIDANFCEYVRLSHPLLRETATTQVMAADMIVVSAKGTETLPSYVQEWMHEVMTLCPRGDSLRRVSGRCLTRENRRLPWVSGSMSFAVQHPFCCPNLFPASPAPVPVPGLVAQAPCSRKIASAIPIPRLNETVKNRTSEADRATGFSASK